ncbi:MAG: DNA replication and repair protein RecF [Saprospiraceae bacterium]|nr:DNA replication and repair protein RecF [Saprospiraceae bacterium]
MLVPIPGNLAIFAVLKTPAIHISSLILTQFKNYAYQSFSFEEGFNLLYGNNGSGKTNVLDAIHYLALGKSHFLPQDKLAIQHGKDFFRISGRFVNEQENMELVLKFQPGTKRLEKDEKPYVRMVDHIGTIGLVMIAPDDLELIDGLSLARRKFIDLTLSQSNKIYLHHLSTYKRLLEQRNAWLKLSSAADVAYLQALDEKMEEPSKALYQLRKNFIAEFIPYFDKYYHTISGGHESVGIQFQSDLHDHGLLDLLEKSRTQDLYTRFTTKGNHKDDLLFLKDQEPMKYIASQGQKKTFLVSLFLAQSDYLSNVMPSPPIILLDDLFDKLDETRIRHLLHTMNHLPSKQVIMTDTGKQRLGTVLQQLDSPCHFLAVRDGQVSPT